MRNLRIAPARPEDLGPLEAAIPSGPSRSHERRMNRQRQGTSLYLIAWLGDQPAGHALVRWDGCDAANVRRQFPGCPEINALEVRPAGLRSQGIGTALITAAEELASRRGFGRIGLGVADDNPRAAALYLRLGFAETGCQYLDSYEVTDTSGARRVISDRCRYLVKDLPRPAQSAEPG